MDAKTLEQARELSTQVKNIEAFLGQGKGIAFTIKSGGYMVNVEGEGKLYETIMTALHGELAVLLERFEKL